MNEIVKVKTGNKYESILHYSRIVVLGDLIMVSNSAGRDYRTRATPPDAGGQTRQIFANLEKALAAVDASLKDVVRIRVFCPDRADIPAVTEVVGAQFDGVEPACTFLCTPLGHDDLRVEIEITAYRNASTMPVRWIKLDL